MSAQLSRATREAAIKAANDKGCIVVEPKPNQLFIDLDNITDVNWFVNAIERIKSRTPLTEKMTPSPSGVEGRFHVVVTFEKLTFSPLERIAYQAALGSDRARELNSICDVLDGDPLPTIFFEREVIMWGGVAMVAGKCPETGVRCLACQRLGKHLEPRELLTAEEVLAPPPSTPPPPPATGAVNNRPLTPAPKLEMPF